MEFQGSDCAFADIHALACILKLGAAKVPGLLDAVAAPLHASVHALAAERVLFEMVALGWCNSESAAHKQWSR